MQFFKFQIYVVNRFDALVFFKQIILIWGLLRDLLQHLAVSDVAPVGAFHETHFVQGILAAQVQHEGIDTHSCLADVSDNGLTLAHFGDYDALISSKGRA